MRIIFKKFRKIIIIQWDSLAGNNPFRARAAIVIMAKEKWLFAKLYCGNLQPVTPDKVIPDK